MSDFSEKLLAYTLWKNTFTADPETWERQVKQAELWRLVEELYESGELGAVGDLAAWWRENNLDS